jgi:gliding motility-associated-like protein
LGRKNLILLGLLILTTLRIAAQSNFEFVENKGQWDNQIKFKGELSTGAFFLQKKGFTVLLHHPTDLIRIRRGDHTHEVKTANNKGARDESKVNTSLDADILRSHSYQVEFLGANENAQITPDKELPFFTNYFIGNDPSKWATHARVFQALLYRDIYPNIDVRYYSENGRLKYDLIVRPGGDVNKIALRYKGADKLTIRNNELIVKTSVGDAKELYPYSFQFDNMKGKKEVECNYVLADENTVKFSVKSYSKDATLIIDPILIFSSFTGSSANQFGFTATPAPDGSFYSGGIVFGQGFPTTPGAYKTSFQGGSGPQAGVDIGIMKFNATGTRRVYATYLGGSANDYPHSLFSDPQGNLVVMGRSYSANYPGSLAVPGSGGGADIVVTKLTANGNAIIGSLRIGGSGMDGVNIEDQQEQSNHVSKSLIQNYGDDSRSEVILDGGNNIYVAAQTSSADFPKLGSGNHVFGGKQDGVVMKIDPSCSAVLWTSFVGGSEDDGTFVLAMNPANGNLYVAGATSSTNLPGNTGGTIQGSKSGGVDGFVTILTNDGSTFVKTTYLGTGATDIVYGIQFDRRGFPYVMGITRGAWAIAGNPVFINANSKQFVAKLQPDLSAYIYSTVFGNGSPQPNISPVAFLVDRCENVYISGWGGNGGGDGNAGKPYDLASLGGLPTTADAIKSITDDRDFYFIVIEKNASGLLYGSFFGQDGGYGEHVDGGTSRYDQQGVIYQAMCANCSGGATFPTTPGVVGPVNGSSGGCNLAAVKIAFNFAGVAAGPKSFFNNAPDSVGCVPFTATLRDTVRNAKSYEWSFGDGTPDLKTTNFETNHTYASVGNYRVRLIAIDSNTCNVRDTAFINIRVRADKATLDFDPVKLPPCQSLTYRFDNLSVAPQGKPFSGTSFTWSFGDGTRVTAGAGPVNHTYSSPGTYKVRLILTDTNYCNAPDSLERDLRIAPLVDAQFETPPGGCAPYDAHFNNTSLAGQQFFWDFGDGTTSNAVNPNHMYLKVGTYTVRMIAIDSGTCNIIDSTQKTITVSSRPTADFSHAPVPAEENKPTVFTNLSIGSVRYKWLFGDGDSAIKTTMDTVLHQYNATGTYQACLIVFNQFGCTDTICKPVDARIVPLLDVPNAFTPGKFGKNSIVRVEGFGIARMSWTIYNRWGQKVFESRNRRSGWDGTFKGQLQPMDVYAYTLDAEFSDGTKARKTGDITLIR